MQEILKRNYIKNNIRTMCKFVVKKAVFRKHYPKQAMFWKTLKIIHSILANKS